MIKMLIFGVLCSLLVLGVYNSTESKINKCNTQDFELKEIYGTSDETYYFVTIPIETDKEMCQINLIGGKDNENKHNSTQ